MFKVKYIRANVEVSDAHTQQVCVPEWEIPILTAMHVRREEGPEVIGQEFAMRDAPPDLRSEYSRLEQRYGRTVQENGSKGAPWVAAVYGTLASGNLKKALDAAVVEVPDAPLLSPELKGGPELPEGAAADQHGGQRQSLDDLGLGLLPDAPPVASQQGSSVGG